MKLAAVVITFAALVGAQEVVTLPVGAPRPGALEYRPVIEAPKPQAQVRPNAAQLVELTGDRERLESTLPKVLKEAKTKMQSRFPNIDGAFADEWERRMAARIKVDDILNIAGTVYEKHFSNEEIMQLTDAMNSSKAGKPVKVSASLQQKMTNEMPAMMGEIAGATTEFTSRLGGEVGREIEREHPEYVRKDPKLIPR
ncbi:MAG TPA: hypothetical protein VGF16_11315 [Bryobacteraceae bacterium]